MHANVARLFHAMPVDLRRRLCVVSLIVAIANIGVWCGAVWAFHNRPAVLGIAALVYGLGIRHAIDADHIAAIDNVTRKLMQAGQRPVSVGFFFAAGHSTVVFVATAAVAGASSFVQEFEGWKGVGSLIGTCVSAVFLLLIAAMNVAIFASTLNTYRDMRIGNTGPENSRVEGILGRLFRPFFRIITRSWHMFPLGILFGLGFDTATEVAMFGLSAKEIANGLPFWAVMSLPMLFAAGMCFVDTINSVMMMAAYDWTPAKPMRKVSYNLSITLISALMAFLIGGVEILGLVQRHFDFSAGFWPNVAAANESFVGLGFALIAVCFCAWFISYLLSRGSAAPEP